MFSQQYECVGIFDQDRLIGVAGLWYQMRHYSGRSCEVDHVYIDERFRSEGIGKNYSHLLKRMSLQKGVKQLN